MMQGLTTGRIRHLLVAALLAGLAGAPAAAQPTPKPVDRRAAPSVPALVGLTHVAGIVPDVGLIDRAIATDGGGLLAYVAADAATRAEVVVIDVATGAETRRLDVSDLTAAPTRLWFVGRGAAAPLLVVGLPPPTEADPMPAGVVGALYDAAGKRVRAFGPAAGITLVQVDGKPRVAVRTETEAKGATTIKLEVFEPTAKAKRVGKARTLTLEEGRDDKLKFRVNHWTADFTVAVGIKDGEWTKKADARSPDREGRYDLVTGTMTLATIDDPMDHKRRLLVLAEAGAPSVFARVAEDLTGVEVWRDDRPAAVTLEQPFELYDPKSLVYAVGDDGAVWLGLAIDPWNRPAVERKKQDPAYFDVYRVGEGGSALRVGRVLAPKARFDLGATAGHVWLLERNVGFSRGGKALTIYRP